MTSASLPPLPRGFRGSTRTGPEALTPWAGASGPFWRVPSAVLLPASTEDVALILPWARAHGLALVPRGAGTGMPGGNVGTGVILDLSRLQRAGIEDADQGWIRAGAGATGDACRGVAGAMGRELPALPSSAPWSTVGGMVACNAAGARSYRLGSVRDWVREVTVVRVDGSVEVLRRGEGSPSQPWAGLLANLRETLPRPLPWPAVRKNSSGYALDRALASGDALDWIVGSEGTLAVVTEVVLETHPKPPHRAIVVLGVPVRTELPALVAPMEEDPLVRACEYLGALLVRLGGLRNDPRLAGVRTDDGLLLLELAGPRQEVEERAERLRAAAPWGAVTASDEEGIAELWEIRHAANPTLGRALEEGRRSTQFIEDCVVPLEHLPDFLAGLDEILEASRTEAVIFGHAGDGNLHVNPLLDLTRPDWRDDVAAMLGATVKLVADLGGTLAGEHGDGRLRTPFLDQIFAPEVIRAFDAVKSALDPDGTLNPGVIVPTPGAEPLAGLGAAPGFASGTQGPEGLR